MKKNLKTLLILLILFVSFVNVNVKALQKGDKFTLSKNGTTSISGLASFGNTEPHTETVYSASGSSVNKTVVSYCEDPNWAQAKDYVVDRILGDESNSIKVRAYDLGMVEIIKNGKTQENNSITFTINGSTKTVSGNDLYTATSIASRAYTMGVFAYGKGIGTGTYGRQYKINKASSYISKAIEWGSNNKEALNVISQTSCSGSESQFKTCYVKEFLVGKFGLTWYDSTKNFNVTKENSQGSNVIDAAYYLFNLGLEKAAKVMKGEETNATVSGTATTSPSDKETNGNTITEYYYQTIEFKNFDKDKGTIDNIALTCTDCVKNNITVGDLEFYNPQTGDYQRVDNINVLTAFDASGSTKSGTVKLRFQITRIKDDENCKSVKYTVSYNYNDPSLDYVGGLLKSKTNTNAQRFLIVIKNDGNLKDEINGTIKCAMSCETEIELPVCSTDEDDSVATITGPTKIKSCVIDNNDDADNSYQFTSNAGGVDNKYCKVYCKEDYSEIRLNPIVQNVKCGGYFKLKSYIKGTKICYTGGDTDENATNGTKSIDKDQYLEDIIAAQKMMINGYHLIRKAEEASASSWKKYNDCSGKCGTCTGTEGWYKSGSFVGVKPSDGDAEGNVKVLNNYDSYEIGSTPTCENNCCSGSCGEDCTCTPSGSCSNGSTKIEVENEISDIYDSGKRLIEEGLKKYKEAITNYNACTTAWTNDFAFAQKVKYYYDENRGTSGVNFTPYYELLDQNEDLKYLEKDGAEKVEYSIEVNTGKTDEKYESGTWITIPNDNNKADKNTLGEYNYNSAYGSVFEKKSYTVCTVDGCDVREPNVSKAAFIKKSVTKEQNYINPTSFYQIAANGKVVVYESNYAFEKVQLEELNNKLPVSTSSVGGGVFKLMIEGLGEFYSEKNEYGRLIDFEQSNEKKSVAYAQEGVTYKLAQYSCYYKNDCRPKDCPNCEFTCEGDTCEWKECPTCNITCVNCIFNLDNLNIIAKTITTTDVKAANRTYGYNWITTSSMQALNLLNKKASVTIDEIEEINEMVYNDKTTDGSTLGFSIKLTPEVISKITDYNKKNEENGGYINDSLTCYDATIDGQTYKNIYCYSELIDKLLDENGENVTVLPSRVNNEGQRSSSTQNSGYWTLWSSFSVDKISESVIGGPSWK